MNSSTGSLENQQRENILYKFQGCFQPGIGIRKIYVSLKISIFVAQF